MSTPANRYHYANFTDWSLVAKRIFIPGYVEGGGFWRQQINISLSC